MPAQAPMKRRWCGFQPIVGRPPDAQPVVDEARQAPKRSKPGDAGRQAAPPAFR
jgi:hypothetical protein